MTDPLLVVGAGLTGGAAVQAMRGDGHDGPIVLVGEEPHPPYERPPLSKEYLRGETQRDALPMWPASWYEEQSVETRFGARVVRLDPPARTVELADGETIRFERALLATGGRPRRLTDPSDRILELRTIEDADRIRGHLEPGRRLVIVGAGFIGAEVAASARERGVEVTMLEMEDVPLKRALGEEMGRVYAEIHLDHGVDLRLGERVEGIQESEGGVVVRTGGGPIEGDAAVIGVGIVPNTELAEEAGLEVENGIAVDERCRTSAEGVFAAGDVADHRHPLFGRRIRVEHYDNALKMGAAAGRCMLGKDEPYDDPHWFWSDQYDLNLQYAGFAWEWDETVVRGSVEERDFIAFYLKGGVLLAALGLNRGREVRRAMKLIAARARPDRSRLANEEVDLRELAPGR